MFTEVSCNRVDVIFNRRRFVSSSTIMHRFSDRLLMNIIVIVHNNDGEIKVLVREKLAKKIINKKETTFLQKPETHHCCQHRISK